MTASKAKQAATALRRARHLELALSGMDNDQIVQTLRDEGHDGVKSRQAASKDLCRMLEKAAKREALNVDQYRKLQEKRLLALVAAVWPKATSGTDLAAVEQTRKLIADLTKLFGVDMPVRTEVSGPGGGPLELAPTDLASLHHLIGLAGEPDPDDEAGEYADEAYEAEHDTDSDDADDGS